MKTFEQGAFMTPGYQEKSYTAQGNERSSLDILLLDW